MIGQRETIFAERHQNRVGGSMLPQELSVGRVAKEPSNVATAIQVSRVGTYGLDLGSGSGLPFGLVTLPIDSCRSGGDTLGCQQRRSVPSGPKNPKNRSQQWRRRPNGSVSPASSISDRLRFSASAPAQARLSHRRGLRRRALAAMPIVPVLPARRKRPAPAVGQPRASRRGGSRLPEARFTAETEAVEPVSTRDRGGGSPPASPAGPRRVAVSA